MSEIHKALNIFGLEPGASREAIQTRYKRLIMVWHPDRFPNEDGKKDAEEELKKINNANDVLKKHFETSHRATGCECQSPAGGTTSGTSGSNQQKHSGPGPGPGTKRKPDVDPEAEARKRDAERARKAAADEAARKAADATAREQQRSTEEQYKAAQRQQNELKLNKLRWQIAAAEAALFIGICIFGSVGHDVKEWWHKTTWEWERDHPKQQDTPPPSTDTTTNTGGGYVPPYQLSPSTNTTPSTNTSPFGPVGPPPGDNPNMLPNGVMKPFDNSNVPIPNYTPQTNTNTTTDTTAPGFNWKPLVPDNGSLDGLKLNKSPLLTPSTSTGTGTTTGSGIDYDKYINH